MHESEQAYAEVRADSALQPRQTQAKLEMCQKGTAIQDCMILDCLKKDTSIAT